ncbi:hypothetical protein NNC19_21805 [Clostridium sp. SHJSY1]|uniref:hypothetical protein n=1 Tax=Clostridium sp. SHJSY1 TaxID=2942483 RepID=UPI00287611B8|nr:hypothetical protein [Clostridium sp. SHJSY1]MDS0528326.1 hypothetical protein [Clostridium sp. SHJSY1]
MKRIFRLLMILAFCMTIYTIFFWEPKEYNNDLKEKAEKTSIINLNNINIDNINLKSKNYKSIFKVNEDSLESSITEENKGKVNTIINSMSELDINRITKEKSNSDKEEGTKKIFQILSKRLSTKDYKIIKNIYEPYIDFSNI